MRQYWVVGATWDDEDKLEEFMEGGYWALGFEDNDKRHGVKHQITRRNEIQAGDLIAIKIRSSIKDTIVIRAVGIVEGIDPDDHRVYVNWVESNLRRKVRSRGHFESIRSFSGDDEWTKQVFKMKPPVSQPGGGISSIPSVWWCNQTRCWDDEFAAGLVCSQSEATEVGMKFRRTVSEARAGDITVHYRSGRWMSVLALSRAKTDATAGTVDLGHYGVAGKVCWKKPKHGWSFEADYYRLNSPIPKSAVIEELSELELENGPILHPGRIRRGYFMRFSIDGLRILRRASNDDWPEWVQAACSRLPDKFEVGESVLLPPERVPCTTTRIIRDTAESRLLKAKYGYRCQICGERIELGSRSFYAEVHHIRPLGGGHRGLDRHDNMLVVCPTHHAMLDLGAAEFSKTGYVIVHGKYFKLTLTHDLYAKNITYHNTKLVRHRD